MSKKDTITSEIAHLPDQILDEILHYIHFLKYEISEKSLETAILSESSLKKDWLRSEEDEAWQDL